MTFRLGLTGSIGMGKSTTAAMFADAGIPVWDADAAVHRLYEPGQPAAVAVAGLFPDAMDPDGRVNRSRLRALIAEDPAALDRLTAVVHPLVGRDRAGFLARHAGSDIVLLDIPLLFESGLTGDCDAVVVVSASQISKSLDTAGKVLLYGIHFDFNKASIKPESRPSLDEIAKFLKDQPNEKLDVVGHTDNIGGADFNMQLSKARADAVVADLVSTYSVSASRLKAKGEGLQSPVASNDDEAGRAKNRRVELHRQ